MPLFDDGNILYWHAPGILLSEDQATFVPNGTGHLYASPEDAQAGTNVVQVFDATGNQLAALTSNWRGEILPFQAAVPIGYARFGSVVQEVIAGRSLLNEIGDAAATIASYESRLAYLEANGVGSVGGTGGSDTFTETFSDTF